MSTGRSLTVLQHPTAEPYFSDDPADVSISITGRCQLRCHHCFNRSGPENRHELPLPVIERFLDEVVGWGVTALRLSGGEPTHHRQFREVVEACRRRGLAIAMNSHGVYPERLLAYLRSAPIAHFLISVDGMEANNDAIRGRGTFRRATHSCGALRAAGRQVTIACHLGSTNVGDVGALVALAAELGVDVKFSPIRPVGRAAEELPGVVLRPEVYLGVVQEITRLRRRYPATRVFTDFDILDGAARGAASGDCGRDPARASCKAGRTMVNVNYDGGIYPCAFFVTPEGEFSAGNIYDVSVAAAWRTSPVFEPFRVHQKSGTCQSCGHYQHACAGGCPAIAHFTTGSLDAHDPTCFATLTGAAGPRA
jgi:radical SAM protein with 4Fe4S-binding SPASM domain